MLDVKDLLLNKELVSGEVLADAVAESAVTGKTLLNILVNRGHITPVQAGQIGAEAAGMEFVELLEYPVDTDAAYLLTSDQAHRYAVIPIRIDGEDLVIAASPKKAADLVLGEDLRQLTGHSVRFVLALQADIDAKITAVYRAESQMSGLARDMVSSGADFGESLEGVTAVAEDTPLMQYVDLMISQAISDRASDIHIEPGEHEVRLRYRIDGVLQEQRSAPKSIQQSLLSRVKILSNIDIAVSMRPQDGRMSINHHGRKIDLRVACLPTVWGEKIVMRILDNSATQMRLSDLGFSDANFTTFEKSFTKPYGMLLVTGPTGSGKSTTLYATLNIVSKPTVNVITVEDPVEYRLAGINQVQVNAKADMTFAAALRSILRADPDIILLGEIRDRETAQIAVEAALTGHLVLSTLHTNDAPSAITRLTEMGIEPFLVGSAVDCVLAQRLARRLCSKCKEPYEPDPAELERVRFPWTPGEPLPTLYRPSSAGCPSCSKGYRGRVALHEVMTVSEEIERLTVEHASAETIAKVAVEQGMVPLRGDGWSKVLAGVTSIEEILRTVA